MSTRSYPRDIEAQITFLSVTEHGRKGHAKTGYRCQFRYDDQDWFALFTFPETGVASPGETIKAYISFLSVEEHRNALHVGKQFEVREGVSTVARGIVTKIIELADRTEMPLEPPSFNYPD